MKLSTLMLIKSLICFIFGLIFVLIPGAWLAIFGVKMADTSLLFMSQLYGAAFIVLGVLLLLARNDPGSEALRAIVLAVTIGDGVGFIVALIAQIGSVMNGLGWFVVAAYFFLSVGFGYSYFQVARPRPNVA